jgi:hypothetical protein
MAKTGKILNIAFASPYSGSFKVNTVARVTLRIQQSPERDVNDFLDFPVGQETLLPIDPGHHRIKYAAKHHEMFWRHAPEKGHSERVQTHLLHALSQTGRQKQGKTIRLLSSMVSPMGPEPPPRKRRRRGLQYLGKKEIKARSDSSSRKAQIPGLPHPGRSLVEHNARF